MRCLVQISVGTQVVLTKGFYGSSHSPQIRVGMSYVTTTFMQTFPNSVSYPSIRLYSFVVSIVEASLSSTVCNQGMRVLHKVYLYEGM
jgi:hypothetical protein